MWRTIEIRIINAYRVEKSCRPHRGANRFENYGIPFTADRDRLGLHPNSHRQLDTLVAILFNDLGILHWISPAIGIQTDYKLWNAGKNIEFVADGRFDEST